MDYVKGGGNYIGDAYLVDDGGYFVYQPRTDDTIIGAGYNSAGSERRARAASCGSPNVA